MVTKNVLLLSEYTLTDEEYQGLKVCVNHNDIRIVRYPYESSELPPLETAKSLLRWADGVNAEVIAGHIPCTVLAELGAFISEEIKEFDENNEDHTLWLIGKRISVATLSDKGWRLVIGQ